MKFVLFLCAFNCAVVWAIWIIDLISGDNSLYLALLALAGLLSSNIFLWELFFYIKKRREDEPEPDDNQPVLRFVEPFHPSTSPISYQQNGSCPPQGSTPTHYQPLYYVNETA